MLSLFGSGGGSFVTEEEKWAIHQLEGWWFNYGLSSLHTEDRTLA